MSSAGNKSEPTGSNEKHCLECGATVPEDSSRCLVCGNEKLILPSRWDPPVDESPRVGIFNVRAEIRALVGLSLALVCGLWFLGTARAGNESRLAGDYSPLLQNITPNPSEIALEEDTGELVIEPEIPDPISNTASLRLAANQFQAIGEWIEAANVWEEITTREDADLSDFISLANALETTDDVGGARDILNRACVRFPDNPEGYIALASLFEQLGNLNASRFQYQIGLTYCEGNPALEEGLGRIERFIGPDELFADELEPEELTETPIETELETEPETEPEIESPLELPFIDIPETQPVELDEEELQSGQDGPILLIGTAPEDVGEPDNQNVTTESSDSETSSLVNVQDLRVDATTDHVTIELIIDSPVALSTSSSANPPRLIVTVPNAQFSENAGFPTSVALNTPLVGSVNLIEDTDDNMSKVMMVIYLGQDTRHSVAADSRSVRISISRTPDAEVAEGE